MGLFSGGLVVDANEAFGHFQTGLDGVGQAVLQAVLNDEAVDDDIDIVFDIAFEFDGFLDGTKLAIDTDADEALTLDVVKDLLA